LQLDPNISVFIGNQYLISQVSHQYAPLIRNFTSLFISMQLYRYSFGYQRNSSLILISPPVPQKKSVLVKSSTPPASIPSQTKRVSTPMSPIQSLHVSTPHSSSLLGENVPTGSPSTLSWPASGSNNGGGPKGLAFFRLSKTNVINFLPEIHADWKTAFRGSETLCWKDGSGKAVSLFVVWRQPCLNTATTRATTLN
jgi:hypothetical protein